MPIPNCCVPKCPNEGTHTLKIEFRVSHCELTQPGMVRMPVCDEHRMDDATAEKFIDLNWEYFCMGFDSSNILRPERKLTTWKWVPWVDAEIFWAEAEGDKLTKQYKQ